MLSFIASDGESVWATTDAATTTAVGCASEPGHDERGQQHTCERDMSSSAAQVVHGLVIM